MINTCCVDPWPAGPRRETFGPFYVWFPFSSFVGSFVLYTDSSFVFFVKIWRVQWSLMCCVLHSLVSFSTFFLLPYDNIHFLCRRQLPQCLKCGLHFNVQIGLMEIFAPYGYSFIHRLPVLQFVKWQELKIISCLSTWAFCFVNLKLHHSTSSLSSEPVLADSEE